MSRFNQTMREALRAGLLPRDYVNLKNRIINEAARLAESPHALDYRTDDLYFVTPTIYRVEKEDGEWACACKRFSQLGFCEHSLAVEIRENEGSE